MDKSTHLAQAILRIFCWRKTMHTNKKIILVLALQLLIFQLSGCSSHRGQADIIASPETIDQKQNSYVAKRFQEPNPQGQTAVESAIELSQKYSQLSEETSALRVQNQELIAENTQLKKQTAELDAKLKQTQKELTEANDFLIDMRIELNNWKSNILGFRDEMMEAETAQLEALLKILKILGAEVPVESAQSDSAPSSVPDGTAAGAGQTKSHETSAKGKTNE